MNVLLVDDQVRILEATKKLVGWKKLGVDKVFTAECADDARAILDSEAVDILLTDIEMPGEDGIALQRWQRERHPEILCIFLTSHADFKYAQEALHNGAYDYILQPAAIPEIEKVLERAIKNLAERRNLIELSRSVNETLSVAQQETMEWSRWIERGETQMLRNRIAAILDDREARGRLTRGARRRVFYAFLEACRVAAHLMQSDLQAVLSDAGEDEAALSERYERREDLLDGVERCLRAFDKRREGGREDATTEQRIREVIHFLNTNLDRMISRSEAARHACLNEDYFSRAFRKVTGMGYKEFALKQKVEYAAKLLANTDLPITVIAAKVGYDSYSNFTQMFRKATGQTPSEYRKTPSVGK